MSHDAHDVTLALPDPLDCKQPRPQEFLALLFADALPHDDLDNSSLVFELHKYGSLGRLRLLAPLHLTDQR